jgi:hypothetical protein
VFDAVRARATQGDEGCIPIITAADIPADWREHDLDQVQTFLDGVGLVPAFGEPADGINGIISCIRGDWGAAALSFAAVVPIAGAGATAAKAVKKIEYLRHLDQAVFARLMKLGVRNGSSIEEILRAAGTDTVIRGFTDRAGNQILLRAGNNNVGLLHIIGRHLTGTISGKITTFFPKQFKVDDVVNVTAQAIQNGSRVLGDNSNWIYTWRHETLGEINVIVNKSGEVISAFPTR